MLAQTFLSDQSHIATGCIPAAGLSVAQPSNDGSIATLVRCARLHIAIAAARQGAPPPNARVFPPGRYRHAADRATAVRAGTSHVIPARYCCLEKNTIASAMCCKSLKTYETLKPFC